MGNRGVRSVRIQAADLLLSSQQLLTMSSVPALCNLSCMCVERLLLEEINSQKTTTSAEKEDDAGGETALEDLSETEAKGVQATGSEGKMMSSRSQRPLTRPQSPSTLTQVHLIVLCEFLSRGTDTGRRNTKSPVGPLR